MEPMRTNASDHQALLDIQELMDGVNWSPDTLSAIADILEKAGYHVRDTNGLLASIERITGQPDPIRVVIGCDGGLVQDVSANVPVDFAMIDYDVKGADDDRLTAIPQTGGDPVQAYAYTAHADVMPERVAELFKAIE